MEIARQIVARFINVNPASISRDTMINHKAVRSSILLHRMYATLADSGIIVANPSSIQTYGELLDRISSRQVGRPINENYKDRVVPNLNPEFDMNLLGVGIDIEDIENVPLPIDCKSTAFFLENFSVLEIDYCMLQVNPRESFASRFSLKEALVKADNSLINIPFNQLEISNNDKGAPLYSGYALSCSHSDGMVVAVAIKLSGSRSDLSITSQASIENVTQLIQMQYQHFEKKLSGIIKLFIVITTLMMIVQLIILRY